MAVWLTAQELQLALKQDQVDIVKRWAQEHGNNPPEFQFQFILARLWLIQGRFGQAARLLATLRQESETTRQIGRLLKSMILQAAALQGQADIVQARLVLTQALRLAEPGGYIRSFADESVPVIELLRQVMQAIPSSDYTARLLAAMQADRQALPLTGQPFNQPAEPLSERELEVLRLVAINLSNQEIAGQLVVSLNTVKTHLKRLYAKLDARNRLEAIERARRLGLL
jgi:LuxR family maltose regulon positive regulatory protein